MSDTSMRLSVEARDEAIRLSGDAKSARVFVEGLIERYKNGEQFDKNRSDPSASESVINTEMWLELRSDIARTHQLIRLIGSALLEDNEAVQNGLNLLSSELGTCPGCHAKMTCTSCGCYLSDHLSPSED